MTATNSKIAQKFLDSVKLLLFQCKIYGLTIFNDKNFQPSKLHTVFNIFAVITYTSAISYCIYSTAIIDTLVIYKATDIIILILNGIYVATAWVCAITKKNSHTDFLLKLIDFDTKLEAMGIKINYKRCQKKILNHCIMRYLILIADVSALVTLAAFQNYNLIVESIDYFLIVINSAICQQTVELVAMLKTRFVILNKQIVNLIEFFLKNNARKIQHKTADQLATLNKVCALHHHLSKLIKLFNEIFGIVLLLMFGVSFVVIVISIFYLTVALQNTEIVVTNLVVPLLTLVTFIVNIVYVCDICYSTIEEVNKTGELIHKIDTEDHDIRDEIEMFSLQIANEQVEFNAAGFFPIDYTLIFSIIGGVTTYIIILIQLAATLAD